MSGSSLRRSFHGPWLPSTGRDSGSRGRSGAAGLLSRSRSGRQPLELVPEPPSAGALGRALLNAARQEVPSSNARERILSQVLSALQRLTSEQK